MTTTLPEALPSLPPAFVTVEPATVTVRHNFETAHRLPFLGGKCTNLHGHSWWAEVRVAGWPDPDGVLVEFGALKRQLREWIDTHLDHGAMLGLADPLVPALQAEGSRLYVFGATPMTAGLPWPTVESVAELLRRLTTCVLAELTDQPERYAVHVTVQETHVNAATAGGPADLAGR